MKNKVVVAGHISIDITPNFADGPATDINSLFKPGGLTIVDDAVISLGGCVSNTGLALDFFGDDVTIMSTIADDTFGKITTDEINKTSANAKLHVREEGSSAYTFVISPPGIDRMFFHNPGVNSETTNEDLDFEIIKQSKVFHFGYPTIMKKYLENDCAELIDLFKKVKSELGVVTSLDLSMPMDIELTNSIDWYEVFDRLLPYVDIFCPSFEEVLILTDYEKYKDLTKLSTSGDIMDSISLEEDIKPIARLLNRYGAPVVLLKCGSHGMYLKTASADNFKNLSKNCGVDINQWADVDYFQKSFKADKVLSATGAGDTSIGAFLHAIMLGYSAKDSVKYAAATGASCVTAHDSISGLLTFEQISQKLDKGWPYNED